MSGPPGILGSDGNLPIAEGSVFPDIRTRIRQQLIDTSSEIKKKDPQQQLGIFKSNEKSSVSLTP